jgi:prophage regulatory protein
MVEFVGIAEIRDMLGGVSRARASVIASRRDFPPPYQVLRMGQIWRRTDVEKYIRAHRPDLADEE